MSIARRSFLAAMISLSACGPLAAQEAGVKPAPPKDRAEAGPLEGRLVAKTEAYTLDKSQRGEEFRASLVDAKKLPEPPAVDFVLVLKNPTDAPVTILVGSDAGGLELQLEGKGAISVPSRTIMTREFRIGKPVEIAPGKTYEIPIKQLKYGLRGVSQHAYWTEPGEYTLAAIYRWPAGKDGRMILKATAEPVKVVVKGE